MNFIRKHWYDIGGLFAICVVIYLLWSKGLTAYNYIVWLSLVSLFLHQLEEYRIAGTFPGMINKRIFKSDWPDRYPLNTNTALIVNVWLGWSFYFLAAIMGDKAIWLGIATITVSLGNIVAHTIVFNIKGKTIYNAGIATSWLFFAPCVFFFFYIIHKENLVTTTDYLTGIPLGMAINIIGVLKMITWLADKNTPYIFEQRNLLPSDRKTNNNS
jgi:hypothetical protein